MNLSGQQRRQLRNVLLDAFTVTTLRELFEFDLNENLSSIVGLNQPLSTVVLEVIGWAGRRGRTRELIQAAVNSNPTNQALRDFAASIGISVHDENVEPNAPNSQSAVSTSTSNSSPRSIQTILRDLISILIRIPVTHDYLGRSTLISHVPVKDSLNRSSTSRRTDITLIVDQLWDLQPEISDDHPIVGLIDVGLDNAGGEETSIGRELIALKAEFTKAT